VWIKKLDSGVRRNDGRLRERAAVVLPVIVLLQAMKLIMVVESCFLVF
jgi:hypothetical protein